MYRLKLLPSVPEMKKQLVDAIEYELVIIAHLHAKPKQMKIGSVVKIKEALLISVQQTIPKYSILLFQ
jgi:hypothetical protein